MENSIIVKGSAEHNLKNVDLKIPKNKIVVFTGVSGSGKSSMAFDTIYAEGQRRYVESLSSYARQFLGVIAKPKVESITGLSPSISIDQKSVGHNPRSTVGTITEIYDYLRLLFARVGHPFCSQCGREISKLSLDEITDRIIDMMRQATGEDRHKPVRFSIYSPVVAARKGAFDGLFDNIRSKGFDQVIVDGHQTSLSDEFNLIKTNKHDIDVVVDEFSVQFKNMTDAIFVANLRSRLFSATETAMALSEGSAKVALAQHPPHLFSEKFACSDCNIALPELEPRVFSFNSPLGACERCRGLGTVSEIDRHLILNENLSIVEGGIVPFARLFFHATWFTRTMSVVLADLEIDVKKPLKEIADEKKDILLWGNNRTYKVRGPNRFGQDTVIHEKFIGLIPELKRRFVESQSEYARVEIQKYMTEEVCPGCHGARLKPEVLSVRLQDKNITQVCDLSVDNLYLFIKSLAFNRYEQEIVADVVSEIKKRLEFLANVGLSYLTLNRTARTLSGGEGQRIRLASQIGSGLTGIIYVLDEPSVGLHVRDVDALLESLRKLRDLGNTIIVVEHDPETIFAADHIVDFGPLAGKQGGEVVFNGTVARLIKEDKTLTARYLSRSIRVKERENATASSKVVRGVAKIVISGCKQFNLKNISAAFPLGVLSCVTGVSGSGKSTLVVETLYKALKYYVEGRYTNSMGVFDRLDGQDYVDKVYLVDQSPIGRTPRSNPATYIGAFDYIRDIFALTTDAREKGYRKGRFSFNVRGGRCEKCLGGGTIRIEMQFLSDVYVECDVCGGRRYNSETLAVKYKGKNIAEVLTMTVSEAGEFFGNHNLLAIKLKILQDVGLGYMPLGQPAPTLSGGEAQRVKLALELSKKETGRTVYILDEPTTGLHLYDIEKLLTALYKLVDKGNTVILIEHNLDVIRNCQYIIDLGPEGGDGGGEIIFQGPVEDLPKQRKSYTGRYLKSV